MVFEILTFLFPPLKAGKLGKTEKITAVMDDVAKGISGAVSKGVVAGKIIAEDFFKQLDNFIKELKNGSQKLQKFFDDLLASLRKQADEMGFSDAKKVSKIQYDDLYKQYGKLIGKGSSLVKQKYTYQFEKLVKEVNLSSMQRRFKSDLAKKKPKPKNEELYLKRRKQSHINFEKGNVFEEIFKRYNGGVKPDLSIKTAFTNRFIDNVKGNVAKELKSGYIKMTKEFQKQVKKDIDILANRLDDEITKVEWHIVEGIDESCIKYIQTMARDKGVLNQITIILY